MNDKELLDRIQGCLMGVAIGDALGMPVETMKHEDIMKLDGGKGVTGFMSPVQKRVWDTADLKAGDTTDDWQLTRAVARSLIRTDGVLDDIDCIEMHVRALEESAFGWGKTTQQAIEDIRECRRIIGDPLPPAEPGRGCGNGIIMKIAPLAISARLRSLNSLDIWPEIKALGGITHPDIRASIAAHAVAHCIRVALNDGFMYMDGRDIWMGAMHGVIEATVAVEDSESAGHDVSTRIFHAYELIGTADGVRFASGGGFHAVDTAAFCVATFMRHPIDFRRGVLEAVNAGGDTDTNASIVGGMIGANHGLESIPKEWREFSPAFGEALQLGEELFEACRR